MSCLEYLAFLSRIAILVKFNFPKTVGNTEIMELDARCGIFRSHIRLCLRGKTLKTARASSNRDEFKTIHCITLVGTT